MDLQKTKEFFQHRMYTLGFTLTSFKNELEANHAEAMRTWAEPASRASASITVARECLSKLEEGATVHDIACHLLKTLVHEAQNPPRSMYQDANMFAQHRLTELAYAYETITEE